MNATLKSKAVGGVFWSFLDRVSQQGIQFVIAIILARLLMPAQFGLIGMLAVFFELGRVFINSGFGAALVQKKETTDVDECSMFYFNILVGLLAAGLFCAIAPWVARFYHQPILTPVMCALSVTLVFYSFGSVQTALLSKRIDFKTQMKISMTATLLSGVIGIALALRGAGVWSLVGQYIGASLFRTLLLWRLNTWRPKRLFRLTALREMFGFSSRLLASSLLNVLFENIYLVVIGRLFAAPQLGLYAGARKIQNMATRNITSVIMQVAFPVFSLMQDDRARLKRSMRRATVMLASINFPVMVGLAMLARPLVRLLLTEKWLAAVPWLQLLCVANLLYPFQSLHLNVLKAQGRSDRYFRLEVLKRGLVVVLIVVTYRWGVTGLIWGQVAMSVLSYYINSYYTPRMIDYTFKEQLADMAPYATISAVMGLGLYLLPSVISVPDMWLLALQIPLGILLYGGLSYFLRLSALAEMVGIARERLRPYFVSSVRT